MLELGVLLIAVAMALHLWHGWSAAGLSHHAVHVLALCIVASVLMVVGGWEHRREWMGLTLLCLAAPGLVAGWALYKRGVDHVQEVRAARRGRMRIGR
jgi:hypothetical protein